MNTEEIEKMKEDLKFYKDLLKKIHDIAYHEGEYVPTKLYRIKKLLEIMI